MNRRQSSEDIEPEQVDFINFVPEVSPQLDAPVWLAQFADVIRRSFLAAAGLGPPVRAVVSCPPQSGKTNLLLHSIACWLKHRPEDPIVYCSYSESQAQEKSRDARDLADLAGVPIRNDSRSVKTWTTTAGGGLRARGVVGGGITGTSGLKWIIIDDPYKGRKEAESAAYRRDVTNSFKGNIVSRLHPNTSVLVVHTRWHEQDLIGWLLKEQPGAWEYINIPAIDESGASTVPHMTLELLNEKRSMGGEYEWFSLYMGQPRPREGKLFPGVATYSHLPDKLRKAIGVDLAYSSKTSADWSIAVAMGECDGYWYVIDCIRRQVRIEDFAEELKAFYLRHMGPVRCFIGRNERKHIDYFQERGIPLEVDDAQSTGDKYVRAQGFSSAWKAGRVLLPTPSIANEEWLEAFTECITEFTGINDAHDDDVDAAVAAFEALPSSQDWTKSIKQPEIERPNRDPNLRIRRRGHLGTW